MKIKSATPAEMEEAWPQHRLSSRIQWDQVWIWSKTQESWGAENCSECVPSPAEAAAPPQLGAPTSTCWDGQQDREGCRAGASLQLHPYRSISRSIAAAPSLELHSCQSIPASVSLQLYPCQPSLGFHPCCSIPASPPLWLHPCAISSPALQLGGLRILLKQSHTSGGCFGAFEI